MDKIRVNKTELLETLRRNREDHRRIFEEALEGFRREAIAELEQKIKDLQAGKHRTVYISKPVPRDHTSDYDRAIRVMEMTVDDIITLSERDFAQYVMDNWGWQREFVRNSYNSTTASGKFSDFMEEEE